MKLRRQRRAHSTLVMKLGAAAHDAGRTSGLVKITLPEAPAKGEREKRVDFAFALDRAALKKVRRREGRYLLRSNLTDTDPAKLWEFYLQLSEVEAAFKDLKGDLAIRPIHHKTKSASRRISFEAHIFAAFMASCLHVPRLGSSSAGRTTDQRKIRGRGVGSLSGPPARSSERPASSPRLNQRLNEGSGVGRSGLYERGAQVRRWSCSRPAAQNPRLTPFSRAISSPPGRLNAHAIAWIGAALWIRLTRPGSRTPSAPLSRLDLTS